MARRRNDFRARPSGSAGPWSGGTDAYPGFHTADAMEKTWAYAQRKAVPEAVEVGPGSARIHDYPVIVGIDMAGLTPVADYDAIEVVSTAVSALLEDALGRAEKSGSGIFDTVRADVDSGYPDPVDEAIDDVPMALERATALAVYGDAGMSLVSALENLEASGVDVDQWLIGHGLNLPDLRPTYEEILMEVVGQYRYLEDVGEDRIVSVHYMRPFWPRITDVEADEGDEEVAEAAEEHGWAVLDLSDLDNPRGETSLVLERETGRSARVEWHGTSFQNLLSAAPSLRRLLPKPPRPYAAARTAK